MTSLRTSAIKTVLTGGSCSRVLLDDLSARLQARGMRINDADAVPAVRMQGFLEDAADLVGMSLFEHATEALVRADYERTKLRNITGSESRP